MINLKLLPPKIGDTAMCFLSFCLSRGRLFGILSTVALSMAFCDFDGQNPCLACQILIAQAFVENSDLTLFRQWKDDP